MMTIKKGDIWTFQNQSDENEPRQYILVISEPFSHDNRCYFFSCLHLVAPDPYNRGGIIDERCWHPNNADGWSKVA